MWTNTGEIAGNGIDDDNNGFIDDIYGYRFCEYDPNDPGYVTDPLDDDGHGTHCAGIIAAEGNNGYDIAGVNWEAKIMAVKFLDEDGGHTDDAIRGIYYVVYNGSDILINSC